MVGRLQGILEFDEVSAVALQEIHTSMSLLVLDCDRVLQKLVLLPRCVELLLQKQDLVGGVHVLALVADLPDAAVPSRAVSYLVIGVAEAVLGHYSKLQPSVSRSAR